MCAYPMLEIYEPNTIQFMVPLSQQDQFFVEEAREGVSEECGPDKDESLLDISARSSHDSSRCSRSASSCHSNVSSRFGDKTFTDDESDTENKTDYGADITEDIQDDEVSSSIEVRPSKAHTNLLEDSDVNLHQEEDILTTETQDDSIVRGDESGISLQDSGICSGRTSTIPTETESSTDVRSPTEADENDSTSSFEEVCMENEAIPANGGNMENVKEC